MTAALNFAFDHIITCYVLLVWRVLPIMDLMDVVVASHLHERAVQNGVAVRNGEPLSLAVT